MSNEHGAEQEVYVNNPQRSTRGSALIIAVIVVVVVGGLTAAFLTISIFQSKTTAAGSAAEKAVAVAEAGIDDTLFRMNNWVVGTPALSSHTGSVSGHSYTVAVSPAYSGATATYTLRATCIMPDTKRGIEAVVSRTQSVLPGTNGGERGVRLDSNSRIDAYDSSLGTYASQAVNGSGSNQHAQSDAKVISNANIQGFSNVKVWGDVAAGGTASMPGGSVSGTVSQGSTPFTLPPVVVPAPVSGLPATPRNIGGNSSVTLPAGDYHWSSFNMSSNSTLTIRGPARVVIDGAANASSNTRILIDSANGPVEFYMRGSVQFNSNTEIRALNRRPSDVRINITTDNYTANPNSWTGNPPVDIDSNADVYAIVYAPNAILNLDSNGHIYGAVMAKKLGMNSNATLHEDKDFQGFGAPGNYRVQAWRQFVP